jgi:hypothetical protein
MATRNTTFKFTERDIARLAELAERQGCSKTEVLRRLLGTSEDAELAKLGLALTAEWCAADSPDSTLHPYALRLWATPIDPRDPRAPAAAIVPTQDQSAATYNDAVDRGLEQILALHHAA